MLDIFRSNAFGMVEMSEAINVFPNNYGRLNQLGLFPIKPHRTRTVAIESKQGVLNVLPRVPVGGPAVKNLRGTRDLITVTIPRFALEDQVLAEDVVAVRKFGTDADLMAVGDLVLDVQQEMAAKFDITLEYNRWGALTGKIYDSDGITVVFDLFAEFGVTQQVINFALDDDSTDVEAKVLELKRWMEQHAFGDTQSGIQVMVSALFFDKLRKHPNVKATYQGWASSLPYGQDLRTRFPYMGVIFEEHIGSATNAAGTVLEFIPDGEGIAFPLGSRAMKTLVAPATFIESVNTLGQLRYSKQAIQKYETGVDIIMESNPLPIMTRPQLLVKVTDN